MGCSQKKKRRGRWADTSATLRKEKSHEKIDAGHHRRSRTAGLLSAAPNCPHGLRQAAKDRSGDRRRRCYLLERLGLRRSTTQPAKHRHGGLSTRLATDGRSTYVCALRGISLSTCAREGHKLLSLN